MSSRQLFIDDKCSFYRRGLHCYMAVKTLNRTILMVGRDTVSVGTRGRSKPLFSYSTKCRHNSELYIVILNLRKYSNQKLHSHSCHDLAEKLEISARFLSFSGLHPWAGGSSSSTHLELIQGNQNERLKLYVDSTSSPVFQLLQVGNWLPCSMFLLLSALLILFPCASALLDSPRHLPLASAYCLG